MAFILDQSHEHFVVPRVAYPDGIVHHVICDGAWFHSPHWDSQGTHCSEKDCEVNHGGIREHIKCPASQKEGKQ